MSEPKDNIAQESMTEIEKETVKSICEHHKSKWPLDNIHVAAANYAAEAKVEVLVEEVPHTFTCKTEGHKVKSITVKVTVPDNFVLQAHEGIEHTWAEPMLEQLIQEFSGHLENIEPELDSDSEDESTPEAP